MKIFIISFQYLCPCTFTLTANFTLVRAERRNLQKFSTQKLALSSKNSDRRSATPYDRTKRDSDSSLANGRCYTRRWMVQTPTSVTRSRYVTISRSPRVLAITLYSGRPDESLCVRKGVATRGHVRVPRDRSRDSSQTQCTREAHDSVRPTEQFT